jgi:D-alanine-D-alanine ligase
MSTKAIGIKQMDSRNYRTDLPVLLLHNIDPSWPQDDIRNSSLTTQRLVDALVEVGHPVQPVCIQIAEPETALEGFRPDEHLIFNWCEELPGIPHSEYQVVQSLERMGFTHTGTASHALALNQDKRMVKRILKRCQIPTPAWQVYTSIHNIHWKRFPAIVKPAFEHCSTGITREAVVQSTAELAQRIHYVLDEFHQPALVEEFIDGREFHVGVVGNGVLRVLPPAEIDYSAFEDIHDRLCTYESNFDTTSLAYQLTKPKLTAVLTKDQLGRLEEVVIAAYRAIDCRDYARMDIRLRDDTFYILDVNPNADISPDTSLVMTAEMAGYSYGQFGSLLVNLAAQRHPIFGLLKRKKN